MPPVRSVNRRAHPSVGSPAVKGDLASNVAEEGVLHSTQYALLGLSFDALHPEGRMAAGPLLLERSAGGGSNALLPWPPLDRQRLQFDRGVSDWIRQEMLSFFMEEWNQLDDPLCGPWMESQGQRREGLRGRTEIYVDGRSRGAQSSALVESGALHPAGRELEPISNRIIPLELAATANEREALIRRHREVLRGTESSKEPSPQSGLGLSTSHPGSAHASHVGRRGRMQLMLEAGPRQSRKQQPEGMSLVATRRPSRHLNAHQRSFDRGEDDGNSLSEEGSSNADLDGSGSSGSSSDSDWALETIDDDEEYDADVAFETNADKEAVF
ncbi:hypothetical protein CCYA_CCYA01G0214 [Cyanidiococcus yangmingshanensis]|nr:hypothetical protein CCYA_CCYA01G0214 [Cyanidiococcus yangmingshanensis]